MEIQEIEVTIEKDGKVRLHVRGVKGKTCLEITRAVELALGNQVEVRQLTPDALDETGNQGQITQIKNPT